MRTLVLVMKVARKERANALYNVAIYQEQWKQLFEL